MENGYKEFKVIVENEASIRIIRPDGTNPKGAIDQDDLKKRTIKFFHNMLAEGNITSQDELQVLGSHLYELLFDLTISSLFKEDYDHVEKDEYLRLVLEFEKDADELAEYPWEYIYYHPRRGWGEDGFFIANQNGLILTRHVPLDNKLKDLKPNKKPLRILIVVSKPQKEENGQELGEILEKKVLASIEGLKTRLPQAIVTDILEQPTLGTFERKLNDFKPHVLHFIGHGKYDGKKGSLALVQEDDPNVADWKSDSILATILTQQESRDYHPPRLVFLHACEGARSTSYKTFGGMALELVKSRIPAVVAMQYKVENIVANLFAETFYQSLSEGKPVDEAVQAGRRKLSRYLAEGESFSSRAFGSPVVFLQSAEGIILAETQDEEEQSPTDKLKFKCPNPDCGKTIKLTEFCVWCGMSLMLCPDCKPGIRIMLKDGHCGICGYPKAASTASTSSGLSNPQSLTNVNTPAASLIGNIEDTIKIG